MSDLTISILQADLFWENKNANLEAFAEKINEIVTPTDLIVLPEMFNTGFTMQARVFAEQSEGETFAWMLAQARSKQAAICGSFITAENGFFYNRLHWVEPDGTHLTYDKRHLFAIANEHEHYTAGTKRLMVQYKGWKICPLICYDLRFPVWSRNTENYDLLLYVANWPERRTEAWKALLLARSIENQSYCVGVNRVGNDGNDIYHAGDSSICDYAGAVLYQKRHENDVFTITLNKEKQANFRQKLPFLQDQDIFLTKF